MVLKCLATGSSGNAYSLTDKEGNILLLDVGIPVKDIKVGIEFQISKVKGVLCTHGHKDHSLALEDFRKMGIPIIAPYLETPKDKSLGHYLVRYFALTDSENHFVHSNADSTECPIYGFFIVSDVEPVRLLYITDCEYVKYRFTDINNILIGINYADELLFDEDNSAKRKHVINGHMELKTGAEFIKITDRNHTLNNVIVGHMSDSSADIGLFAETLKKSTCCNIHFARKGASYELLPIHRVHAE